MPEVIKPIFFIGMGRSGSSLIFDTFMHSNELAFISQYCKVNVRLPQLTYLHRFFKKYRSKHESDLSFIKKFTPIARESYKVWDYLCGKQFSKSFLRNVKATAEEKTKTKDYICKLLFWQRKTRFAEKLTGPPRISYLSSIYNDIIFIDIIRDPRAVVNSLLNADFRIRKDLTTPYWEDSITNTDKIEWNKFDRSTIALAALEWRSAYELTQKELNAVHPKYLRVKYEDFVYSPHDIIRVILNFVNMKYSPNIDKFITRTNFISTNDKYKKDLSSTDIEIISTICKKEIYELGYQF